MSDLIVASILVVEDSDEDFDTLLEAVGAADVKRLIHRAASGGDCLAMLRGEVEVQLPLLPALILMDLNSHGVDGRDALVTIKTDAILKKIPVVVLTASASPKDVAFCYQAGANAYHVKPVRHDHHLLLLRSLLNYWLDSAMLPPILVKVD